MQRGGCVVHATTNLFYVIFVFTRVKTFCVLDNVLIGI